MDCELDATDCFAINNAAHRLDRYANDLMNTIKEYIDDYGESDVLVESVTSRYSDVVKTREDLMDISKKCGCDK